MSQQFHPETIRELSRIHRDELLREAENYRLSLQAAPSRPPTWTKWIWNLGSILVALGNWLMTRPFTH
jgi:hypothetical protein